MLKDEGAGPMRGPNECMYPTFEGIVFPANLEKRAKDFCLHLGNFKCHFRRVDSKLRARHVVGVPVKRSLSLLFLYVCAGEVKVIGLMGCCSLVMSRELWCFPNDINDTDQD